MNGKNRSLDWQSPPAEAVVNCLNAFRRVGGAMTLNLFCYQDGSVYPPDFRTITGVRQLTRDTKSKRAAG
jgi:hypothetical protein